MAGMTATIKQQWLKCFPPSQQRGIMGSMQAFLSAYKQGPNSTASSAVLTADPELIIPMVQSGIPYNLSMVLNISAMAAAGNIQFDFGASTATLQTMILTTQFYTAAGVQAQGAIATSLTTAVNGGTSAIQVAAITSGLVTFSSPGSFALRVAQQASNATATVVDVNSFILLESTIPTVTQ